MSWTDRMFEVDEVKRTVVVHGVGGEKLQTFTRYRCFHSNREVLDSFDAAMKRLLPGEVKSLNMALIKDHYDKFEQVVGTYPKQFKKVFNTIMKKLWVVPVEKYVQRYAFGQIPKRFDRKIESGMGYSKPSLGVRPHLVTRAWELKNLLDLTEEDGLKTIQPFVFHMSRSPAELKKLLGKGLWKRLCGQSYTRNRACAKGLGILPGSLDLKHVQSLKNQLELMLQLPSKYLVRGGNNPIGFGKAAIIYVGLEKRGEVQRLVGGDFSTRPLEVQIIGDTLSMASRLGVQCNPEWPWAKWEEKHEEFTARVELGKFSTKVFDWTEEPWVVRSFSTKCEWEDEWTFTLLDNAYAIRKEGLRMHHCVSAYAHRSEKRNYMVYHVTKNGESYSTLGLTIAGNIVIQQHLKACNKAVSMEAKECANKLRGELNKNYIAVPNKLEEVA